MRKLDIPVFPLVIAFILANNLQETLRRAFAVTGGYPWFLFKSPITMVFLLMAVAVVGFFSKRTH